ncbi:hypothetical protein [Halomicrobium salinisoli]|uniref:hypothetical protein n=1 Tax=Halomicrobium salinisoli TaxID=2878391 RepID=UPI001CEFFCB9|nr:hypothetical protein [Halomicrobium salinisoli]
MIPNRYGLPATPQGRYRHVGAYLRLVRSLVLIAPVTFLLDHMVGRAILNPPSYHGPRSEGVTDLVDPELVLLIPEPLHEVLPRYLGMIYTSDVYVAVLLAGLVCTVVAESRKRNGGSDR